jgi:hypothetical protein
VTTVARVIGDELARWNVSAVEESVFGTGDPAEIAAAIDAFCRRSLGRGATEGLFYRSSVGCVIGLVLDDGERVVLKAYQARWSKAFLDAVGLVQGHLAAAGFCCATPLRAAEALPERANLVITESWLADPGMEAAAGPRAQQISAVGLARQIDLCRPLGAVAGLQPHPQEQPTSGLYPEPHSPLFDFRATGEGAEWIDAIAERAQVQRQADGGRLVIAHTDWCARNVRITDRLAAVYDWDSLALVTESTAVGQTAAIWAVTSEEGGSDFPSVDQIQSYVHDYEVAVGRPFSQQQWSGAAGAAASVLAYIARCEHSLAVTGQARPDQHGASHRLQLDADTILGLGERRPLD